MKNELQHTEKLLHLLEELSERIERLESKILANAPAPLSKHYSSKFAQTYLGISKSTLDKKCSHRLIRFTKIGNKLRRFTIEDLDAYLAANPVKTDAEMDDEVEMMMLKKSHRLMQKAVKL